MESIEQKQQYLCQHIIEGGYDADEFTHYCERVMGGIDIAGWTFSDLEHVMIGVTRRSLTALLRRREVARCRYKVSRKEVANPTKAKNRIEWIPAVQNVHRLPLRTPTPFARRT